MTVELAILGNLVLDDVVTDDGRTRLRQPGGATLYAALGAALWKARVGVVARVGEDYPAEVLSALEARGVAVEGVRAVGPATLRSWLLYEGRRRRVVHRLDGPSHDEVSPRADEIPAAWRPRAYHLAPMPLAVQLEVAQRLAAAPGALVTLDPFALLTEEALPDWRPLLAAIDGLLFSEDEMLLAGGLDDPLPALGRLAGGRLAWVAYKRGPRGGLLWDTASGTARRWEGRAAEVVDTTGAGDAFAGGLLSGLLDGEPLGRALERGVVSASFALAGPGAEALLAAGPEQAAERRRDWFPRAD